MDHRVQAAVAFMKTNLECKFTALDVAQAVRLSPSRLRELFRDETGKSVTLYRKELQLQRAKQLLETTFLSVKEVAASVGIDGVSHFVRDFKKTYGFTPTEYAECYRSSKKTP
jgi:transcriptional regulator GlxA family with amidase domain